MESMQQLVGGLIQVLYPFRDAEVALICNDEGKLLGLPFNRALRDERGATYLCPSQYAQVAQFLVFLLICSKTHISFVFICVTPIYQAHKEEMGKSNWACCICEVNLRRLFRLRLLVQIKVHFCIGIARTSLLLLHRT